MPTQTINWSRAILIDQPIDDELVRRLTPTILALRQENNDPITVGINSPGGSLTSLDILLGLLTGPNQNAADGNIITVVTHRAFSAAASFLAFGDYSVALRHSQILYHDVRYGGIEDVTPEKARDAAKSLQDANDSFSLRLANQIIRRLVWVYIDLSSGFEEINRKFPRSYEKFNKITCTFARQIDGQHSVDIASFATSLYAKLSRNNDQLVVNVMKRLERWIAITQLAKSAPTYRKKGSRTAGLLDGAMHLHKQLKGTHENFKSSEDELKLLLALVVKEISLSKNAPKPFPAVLETALRDYSLIQSMNDKKHQRSSNRLMLQHELIFFGRKISDELEGKSEEEQLSLLSTAVPYAQMFWHFCVSLCRELFEGEHILNPKEAQLLGLVDEVAGGGLVESHREWRLKNKEKHESAAD